MLKKIVYDYSPLFKNILQNYSHFNTFNDFRKEWYKANIIVIPIFMFDLIGMDIRFIFKDYGINKLNHFILIGSEEVIDFVMTQNEEFLQNNINIVLMSQDFSVIEAQINNIENIILKEC